MVMMICYRMSGEEADIVRMELRCRRRWKPRLCSFRLWNFKSNFKVCDLVFLNVLINS